MSRPPSRPANADQILLLHGWWGGAWVWDRIIPCFEKAGFTCHTIDGDVGVGGAKCSEGETFSEVHQEVLQQVRRLDGPIVIGHSAGALQAQKLVEQVDLPAVVLLGSAAPRGIRSIRTLGLLAAAIRHAPEIIFGRPLLPSRREMCSLNLNKLPASEQEYVYRKMVPVSARQVVDVAFTGVPIDESRVHTPMLVMNGAHDRLTPPGIARAITRKYKAEYVEYPEHAHYLMREPRYEEIATDICRWLRRPPSGRVK